jgi:superfamily II DNA helicase RecQ
MTSTPRRARFLSQVPDQRDVLENGAALAVCPMSPLAPFRFGSLGSDVGNAPARPQPRLARTVAPRVAGRPARAFGLADFRALDDAGMIATEAEAVDEDVDEAHDAGECATGAASNVETNPDDAAAYNGRRRKVKRAASRIARPKDAMPGFKKRSGGFGGGGGCGATKRAKGGTSTVGKQYLNRRMTVAAYYGKEMVGDEDTGTQGDVNVAAEQIKKMERELILSGPAVELHVPKCLEHNIHCKQLKVKKAGRNKGRFFFSCNHPQRYQQCNFFVWEDELVDHAVDIELSSEQKTKKKSGREKRAGKSDNDDDDGDSNGDGKQCSETIAPALHEIGDSEPNIEKVLTRVLADVFGFSMFRAGQMDVMMQLLRGHSSLAVLPTGGGKSLCYQLYAAVRPGVVIVVTPLISLMLDQLASLPQCIPGACLRSGQQLSATLSVERKLLDGELKVLFVSPERLFTDRFSKFMRRMPANNISLVVVDEAHCISEMGHNFRSSYLRLQSVFYGAIDTPTADGIFGTTPVLALTATATENVSRDVRAILRIQPEHEVRADLTRRNLRLTLSHVNGNFDAKAVELIRLLRSEPFSAIVGSPIEAGVPKDSKATAVSSAAEVRGWGKTPDIIVEASAKKKQGANVQLGKTTSVKEYVAAVSAGVKKRARQIEPRKRKASVLDDDIDDIDSGSDRDERANSSARADDGASDADTSQMKRPGTSEIPALQAEGVRQIEQKKRRAISSAQRKQKKEQEEAGSIPTGLIIVYVSKQRECETVCNYLRSSRLCVQGKIEMYHAGMTLSSRSVVQRAFDAGKIGLLVATVAFGMGLDNKDVRGVIHFDIPFSIEAYAQEVGRAGRDGRAAACHLFVTSHDAQRMKSRAHSDGVDLSSVRQFLRKILRSKSQSIALGRQQKSATAAFVETSIDEGGSGYFVDDNLSATIRSKSFSDNTAEEDVAENQAVAATFDSPADRAVVSTSTPPFALFLQVVAHRYLERDLDMSSDTCETICTYLERTVPGFSMLPSRQGTLKLKFFSKTPTQLMEEKQKISKNARDALSVFVKRSKHRNGVYELVLYPDCPDIEQQKHIFAFSDSLLRMARELKAGGLVDFELLDDMLVVSVPNHLLEDTARVNSLVALIHKKLAGIEANRQRKGEVLIDVLTKAEGMLSDEEQSQFLHDALTGYFSSPIKVNDRDVTDARIQELSAAETTRVKGAVRLVLVAEGYGSVDPKTPRQVARILHGIQSPAFTAKAWCRCDVWGKFVHVDFTAVKQIASDVIRTGLSVEPYKCRH